MLANWPVKDVRVICVSTGGHILGLGDLGTNVMGIPIGKLQLYTACAGVPPIVLLPVLLDCGTDNQQLLDDPLYLGLKQKRPTTDDLNAFVQEFVDAVQGLTQSAASTSKIGRAPMLSVCWLAPQTRSAATTMTFREPAA